MPQSELPTICARVDELLEALVDGELQASEEERLRRHLTGCRRCAASYELARRIHRELPALAVECPPRVEEELRRRIEVEADSGWPAWRRSWRAAWRLLPIAAAVAALALLSLLVVHRSRQAGPTPAEVVAAEEQIRLAFAYVGEISHRSAVAAVQEVLVGEVGQTVEGVARRLEHALEPEEGSGSPLPDGGDR